MIPGTVARALIDKQAPTPPLDDILDAYHDDPGLLWQLGEGHLVNIIEMLIEDQTD